MYEQILAALKAKFPGVSEAILSRIARNLANTATTDVQVTTAVEGVTMQSLLESYGDSRANEASESAVRNYEKKHGLKDGKAVNQTQPSNNSAKPEEKTAEGVPEWAQSLIDQNKALTERLDRMSAERSAADRKAQLEQIVSKLPENLRKPYSRISLDAMSDDDFSALTADITKEVDSIAGTLQSKGAVFGRPSGGAKPREGELTDAQKAAVTHRDAKPASEGQPF